MEVFEALIAIGATDRCDRLAEIYTEVFSVENRKARSAKELQDLKAFREKEMDVTR